MHPPRVNPQGVNNAFGVLCEMSLCWNQRFVLPNPALSTSLAMTQGSKGPNVQAPFFELVQQCWPFVPMFLRGYLSLLHPVMEKGTKSQRFCDVTCRSSKQTYKPESTRGEASSRACGSKAPSPTIWGASRVYATCSLG